MDPFENKCPITFKWEQKCMLTDIKWKIETASLSGQTGIKTKSTIPLQWLI